MEIAPTKRTLVEDNMMYSERLGLEVNDREKYLPSMYWIPKCKKTLKVLDSLLHPNNVLLKNQ